MAQTINVDVTPSLFQPTLHYHQGDIGRELSIIISSKDGYSIPSGAVAKIQATKPSGFGFSIEGTISGNTVSFSVTETMSDESGNFPAQIEVSNNGIVLFTANFRIVVQRNVHPDWTVDGDMEHPEIKDLNQAITIAVDNWLDDHPEATTTVQDGSLTETKFSDALKLKAIKDYVTPQMFGAKGDGSTDDTASFRAAISSGMNVFIPNGTYKVTGTLNVTNAISIEGESIENSVINFTGSVLFNITSHYSKVPKFRNIKILCNAHTVFDLSNESWGTGVVVQDVYIEGADDGCITITSGFNCYFSRMIMIGTDATSGNLIYLSNGSSDNFSNNILFDSCVFIGKRGSVNIIDAGTALNAQAQNTTFESFTTAVKGNMTLKNCWFENGSNVLESGSNNLMLNCSSANIESIIPNGNISSDENRIDPMKYVEYKDSQRAIYDRAFEDAVRNIKQVTVGGYVNGSYSSYYLYRLHTDGVVFNVPINKKYVTSNDAHVWYYYEIQDYNLTRGVFELTITYIRFVNDAVVQTALYKAIIKNGVVYQIEKTSSDGSAGPNVSVSPTDGYIYIGAAYEGHADAIFEIMKVSN